MAPPQELMVTPGDRLKAYSAGLGVRVVDIMAFWRVSWHQDRYCGSDSAMPRYLSAA
jgi:hypothetical protein